MRLLHVTLYSFQFYQMLDGCSYHDASLRVLSPPFITLGCHRDDSPSEAFFMIYLHLMQKADQRSCYMYT